MTASTLMDYDADAADRLQALMQHRDVPFRDRLRQSAATAGAKVELAKPSVVGPSRQGASLRRPRRHGTGRYRHCWTQSYELRQAHFD